MEFATLGEAWNVCMDTLSGMVTPMADPARHVSTLTAKGVSVTDTLVSFNLHYGATVLSFDGPRPASTLAALRELQYDAAWRRAPVCILPPGYAGLQPNLVANGLRGDFLNALYAAFLPVATAWGASQTHYFNLGSDFLSYVVYSNNRELQSWTPTYGGGVIGGTWDIAHVETAAVHVHPPGAGTADDALFEHLRAVIQWPGLGDVVNAPELAALDALARRLASVAASRSNRVRTHRDRTWLQLGGRSVTLPPQAWTTDRVLARLARALAAYCSPELLLKDPKSGAQLGADSAVLVPGGSNE